VRQLFEHQTIAELAAAAGSASAAQAEQGAVTGPVPLTPIQRWFFEQDLPNPHHFNQAQWIEFAPAADADHVEEALRHLLAQHDALRLCFAREPRAGVADRGRI
jgi:hypothetical protein